MKKSFLTAATLLFSLPFTMSASAEELVSPLASQTEVTVKNLAGSIVNPKVFPLANGSSLVTWQEQTSDGYLLKTRTVSPSNRLGVIHTINVGIATFLNGSSGVEDTIAINRSGKLFAVWATPGIRYSVPSQTVWGRTSLDGSNWSKPFVVIPGLSVSGNPDSCENEPAETARCGFLRLQAAIDDKSRLAVLVSDNIQTTGIRYRMKSSSFLGKWGNFKTLTSVNNLRQSEILGLTSGFMVGATVYNSSSNNSIKTSYYDPKAEAWTNTSTPISISANTVISSQWVQRGTKDLTLAMASSDSGGVSIRNFNVDTKSWTSPLTNIQVGEPNHVFQDIRAAKAGSSLILMTNVYDQGDGSTEVRVSNVVGLSATTSVVGTSNDQIDLLTVGSSLSGTPLVAFNHIMEGAKFGGITISTLPAFLPNTATHSYLSNLRITKSDRVIGVGLRFGVGTTAVTFTQGYLR